MIIMPIEQIVAKYRFGIIARRWAALWIDGVILMGFLTILVLTLSDEFYKEYVWLWIVLMFSYFVVLESLKGWTVGKLLMKIRVVNVDGKHVGLLKSLIRNVLKILEANPIMFGGLLAGIVALISKKKQRIGDMLAKTYVVLRDDVDTILPREKTPKADPSFIKVVKTIQETEATR